MVLRARHGAAHPALSRSDYGLVLIDQPMVLSRATFVATHRSKSPGARARGARVRVAQAKMPHVPTTFAAGQIAAEAGCDADRVRWLADIGILTSDEHERFTYGSVLAVKMVSALMERIRSTSQSGSP
jgi:hypothetical protein